jgi:hypothetical protein
LAVAVTVATPEPSVTALDALSVAEAPEPGAENSTVTPDTGLLDASVTVALSAVANAVLTAADCDEPPVAAMLAGTATDDVPSVSSATVPSTPGPYVVTTIVYVVPPVSDAVTADKHSSGAVAQSGPTSSSHPITFAVGLLGLNAPWTTNMNVSYWPKSPLVRSVVVTEFDATLCIVYTPLVGGTMVSVA